MSSENMIGNNQEARVCLAIWLVEPGPLSADDVTTLQCVNYYTKGLGF